MALTPADKVYERAVAREQQQGSRIAAYRSFMDAYFEGAPNATASGERVVGSYGDGRPALMLNVGATHDELASRKGAPNLLYPMVKDLAAVRSVLPNSKVRPQSADQADTDVAVKRSRALDTVYRRSKMNTQQASAGFFLSNLGDVCYTLDPYMPDEATKDKDPFRPAGVYIRAVNPAVAFPKFRYGHDARELADLYLIEHVSKFDIKDTYDIDVSDATERVIHFYSRTEKQVLVGRQRVSGVEHDLGFVPAQWGSNEITDGRLAQSDISHAVELHREMQAMYMMFADSMLWGTYPIVHVHQPQFVGDGSPLKIGPGATIPTIGDGNVTLLSPAANPHAASLILETVIDNLTKIVGVAPVRVNNQVDRSNVSGRSIHAQQEPMQGRMNVGFAVLGESLERLNSKIMLMYYKIPELNKLETPMYGADRNGAYTDKFTGEDFGGWIENEVKWDPFLGSNRHERVVVALQLHKENPAGYPWRRVLEEAGEDDPAAVIAEAQAEMKAMQALQAQMQGPPPGGPGGAPPPGAGPPGGGDPQQAAHDAVAMGAGGQGGPPGGGGPPGMPPGMNGAGPAQPPPPQGMPGFPSTPAAPTDQGMGSPAPMADPTGPLHDAVAQVQLRGEITDGPRLIPGAVYVEVTDHRDIKPLKDALDPIAKQILGPAGVAVVRVPRKSEVANAQ